MADAIEQLIIEKGADTAPRVIPQMIEENIAAEYGTTGDKMFAGCPEHPSLKLLTICVIILENGFTIISHSACASPENFDYEIGYRIARENAVRQIWPLMGYVLKNDLNRAKQRELGAPSLGSSPAGEI